ncbi:MAG: DUF4399 domain-containing protein [Shimia sp.]|uniref:DUF4399 domain-containing protein n=1 Tax=Shimia sp. TaxID=1954381 RepID=UPI001B04D4DB|nr:DUF4399 domain-containing protein [Shimia sp.]MBO6896127.1 DUF4399 domain-containing protein [Shimia sp.]
MKKLMAALVIFLSSQAFAGETPSPEGAKVYFINLSDGDSVEAPFVVNFGLSGMGVAPAGTEKENTGHHHIFINRPPLGEGAEDAELMENGVPTDDNHRHFGGGQTEVTLDLPAGTHTLQLVLGDEFHVPHNPPVVSEVITITVK